ncbi:tryptophan synthase subunit alpha [[Clostridium] aminophilum]|uniref:tryptophan synthase subunit alpha n=1 Tax=[Clostridium] aminophilum TaxID=1526 RepID=UPI003320A485
MSRIRNAFNDHKAFIAFITAGDPDILTTKKAIIEAVRNGADLIEIGIPFSDPTAEGPVIMEADRRALEGGVTTDDIFQMTHELREEIAIPLVYMTYANVVFSYGMEFFAAKAKEAGIDGVILPDVPFEEKDEFDAAFAAEGIDLISMIAPTSGERIAQIAKEAKGFIYMVSSLGVTGTRTNITTDIGKMTEIVRANTDVPCAVGFGISTPEQAENMAKASDGAIVGSAIIKILAQYGKEAPEHVGAYVKGMAEAVHR